MLLAKPTLNFPDGPWISLLEKAYRLLDAVAADGFNIPRWSLGGGTVLMFHYAHRRSKDIEIFTKQCESRKSIMLPAFDAIEKIDFDLSFDECLQRAKQLKADLLRLVL